MPVIWTANSNQSLISVKLCHADTTMILTIIPRNANNSASLNHSACYGKNYGRVNLCLRSFRWSCGSCCCMLVLEQTSNTNIYLDYTIFVPPLIHLHVKTPTESLNWKKYIKTKYIKTKWNYLECLGFSCQWNFFCIQGLILKSMFLPHTLRP